MYELKCRHAGFDCPHEIRAASEQEVLQQAAVHARDVHHTEVDEAMARQVAQLIRKVD